MTSGLGAASRAAQAPAVSPERAREALDEVLARAEFADHEEALAGALSDFLEWLGDLFGDVGGELDPAVVEGGLQLFLLVVSVLAGVLLVLYVASLVRSRRRARGRREGAASGALTERVGALRARAREAQAAGDLTRALRLYFFALVVGLGERGELAYDDAWTNRELLERGDPSAEVGRLLGPLVAELDAHSFGRRPTDPEEVRRFAGLCERLLGEGAA